MFRRVETSGKSVEEALQIALSQLGCTREEAVVEELVKPRAGFLGLGAVEARIAVTYQLKPAEVAQEFLSGLLARMGIEANVSVVQNDEAISLDIRGEDMGIVIGRRSETLDALQYITSIVVNRGQDGHIKVIVDTGDYRRKREESLVSLANKIAVRVLKYKKNVTLEPMSAYERRVIHSALQDTAGVTTFSIGSEPNRRVVIALSAGSRATRRGGSRNRHTAENAPTEE
ncbi:MAG: protein jag [Clostridiales bacterium]|jgi:spoIIIJ-associated protein|nr:protein jag [Clostridiales bacterium]